jgi:hypothetical protein
LGEILDFFEDSLVLFNTHTHQFIAAVILIKDVTSLLFQFFHMGSTTLAHSSDAGGGIPNEHLSQFDKVAMFFIVYFDDTPWIFSCADDPAVFGFDGSVTSDDGEWDF